MDKYYESGDQQALSQNMPTHNLNIAINDNHYDDIFQDPSTTNTSPMTKS